MSAQGFGEFGSLLSASAVRERCHRIGELALHGRANWFAIDESGFDRCVDLVIGTCLKYYPDLNIPPHSRWRHFEIGNTNLWQHYIRDFDGDSLDLARSAVDLVFVSVLLDAGAGSDWQYHDSVTGSRLSRSEGLAAASVALFFDQLAQFDRSSGWSLEAEKLNRLTRLELSRAFQHSSHNPLLGIDGRLALLHGLGRILQGNKPDEPACHRPGYLIDECLAIAKDGNGMIDITQVLSIILTRFGGMWPSGYQQQNMNLGDCGYHSLLTTGDQTSHIVPFHKLSQWLTYSLIEPLQWAGLEVTNLDGLTGLPEYRNGGLFIDGGALKILDQRLQQQSLSLESEAVVEWRAATVFLLDRLANSMRQKLELDSKQLPLASVLQGGSWMAGREIASDLRAGGAPPLRLAIDGTIF